MTALDTTMSTASGAISSPMIAALERAWSAIRTRHPELPEVVIVLGAGSGRGPALTLGHFAAMRWRAPDSTDHRDDAASAERWAEVFVGGEGLARGPADVVATLLHEAAHALAHVRGVQDTSRQGRWHNARFRALAEEVGIEVSKDPRLGWSPTALPSATRGAYAEVIAELGHALCLARAVEATGGRTKATPTPSVVCACGRRLRVGKTVLAAGPILCGLCGTEFAPERGEDEVNGAEDDNG